MPLVYRNVTPRKLCSSKLELQGKYDSEFIAANNKSLVSVLRQLASLVHHATDIFSDASTLAEQVNKRIISVKLKLDELEAKSELFDPKLVPVPEGSLDDVSVSVRFSREVYLEGRFFTQTSRPRFLCKLFQNAGSHQPSFPPRSPVPATAVSRKTVERLKSLDNRRPASFAALRDWKLDDYLDEKIATLGKKKQSAEELSRALASPFPSQLIQVDVTGQGFDRMKRNRRSLVVHTKRIRNKKRRNTICGSMPNKECGIQTSFSSVNSPTTEEETKKYGIDSGHWSSCTTSSAQGGNVGTHSTTSAPSPWDPTSLSTSSDFLFDDEDRCLTPQLENFTDGLVSDSDSVDTDGYFTSFRSDCGFPKSKKSSKDEGDDGAKDGGTTPTGSNESGTNSTENEYELFGKGSTSTTASSCGTVVLRNKPNPPARTTSVDHLAEKNKAPSEDAGWEERLKRKSLIERVPSLVVVTPSPSCSSESPPPLKDPGLSEDSEDSGRITPKAEDLSQTNDGSECGTLSDDTDSELLRSELTISQRPSSTGSSTGTASSENSTSTLTSSGKPASSSQTSALPQPDVIPDVQQLQIVRCGPKLDVSREYYSLDTVLLGSSSGEERRETDYTKMNVMNGEDDESLVGTGHPLQSPQGSATSGKIRGARVVLDANGEIIFASETLRRKRKPKVSFDPGSAVKTLDYDNCATYGRIRESVYDRLRKDPKDEKLYECIEEIRRQNMNKVPLILEEQRLLNELREGGSVLSSHVDNTSRSSSASSNHTNTSNSSRYASRPPLSPPVENSVTNRAKVNVLLETDLDSAIPPSMPDLKNLPKIKDRLKRNESYRIANPDDVPPPPTRTSPSPPPTTPGIKPQLSPGNNKLISSRRMSFTSPNNKNYDASPNGNLHLNKKRDILEEDPNFIAQILNLSTTSAKSPQSNPFSSRITLSKLALSPEDRPSFLRRDSPPTMDDIAKEIYRFRKKFNIQPNATTRNLTPTKPNLNAGGTTSPSNSTPQTNGRPESSLSGKMSPQSSEKSYQSSTTIPIGFPKLHQAQQKMTHPPAPLWASTPVKRSANVINHHSTIFHPNAASSPQRIIHANGTSTTSSHLSNDYYSRGGSPSSYQNLNCSSPSAVPMGTTSSSLPPPPPLRNFSSSGRKIFPTTSGALNQSDYGSRSSSSMGSYTNNGYGGSYSTNSRVRLYQETPSGTNSKNWSPTSSSTPSVASYRRSSMSLAEPSPGSLNLGPTPRTSLNDFKKLLQTVQRNKHSVSAMEILKPKVGLETTI